MDVEKPETAAVAYCKSGDNLYKIAQNYDITVSDIVNKNNLTSTNLSIGQILEIPLVEPIKNTYVVQKGDS